MYVGIGKLLVQHTLVYSNSIKNHLEILLQLHNVCNSPYFNYLLVYKFYFRPRPCLQSASKLCLQYISKLNIHCNDSLMLLIWSKIFRSHDYKHYTDSGNYFVRLIKLGRIIKVRNGTYLSTTAGNQQDINDVFV